MTDTSKRTYSWGTATLLSEDDSTAIYSVIVDVDCAMEEHIVDPNHRERWTVLDGLCCYRTETGHASANVGVNYTFEYLGGSKRSVVNTGRRQLRLLLSIIKFNANQEVFPA